MRTLKLVYHLYNKCSASYTLHWLKVSPILHSFSLCYSPHSLLLAHYSQLTRPAPSYFSQYFRCQLEKQRQRAESGTHLPLETFPLPLQTLLIDRDPHTFADIVRHLQGYHIVPRDSAHFVKLLADAQYYQLPRLISQLYDDGVYITIGGKEFKIEKDLFKDAGNSPNFFTLGFGANFTTLDQAFPGLDREGLLRPPSIVPPCVGGRSAEIFSELVDGLKRYEIETRSEVHRNQLLRDCKYFMFKGLEQKLIPHRISYDAETDREEICLRLEDIRANGLSVLIDDPTKTHGQSARAAMTWWVQYRRPFIDIDTKPRDLVLEIDGEIGGASKLLKDRNLEFIGETDRKMRRLTEVVVSDLNTKYGDWEELKRYKLPNSAKALFAQTWHVATGPSSVLMLDGEKVDSLFPEKGKDLGKNKRASESPPSKKRRTDGGGNEKAVVATPSERRTIKRGLWKLKIRPATKEMMEATGEAVQCVLVAVKVEAYSGNHARNEDRDFLS